MNFLSFVAPGLNTPLVGSFTSSHACRALPEESLASYLNSTTKPNQEQYYSLFSFDENALEKAKNSVTFKGFKGTHKLSMDLLTFDFDNKEDPMEAIEEAKTFIKSYIHQGVPYALFHSGSKGAHLYLPARALGSLLDPSPSLSSDIKRFVTKLQSEFKTIDTSVYDVVRKFRSPGSMHGTTKKPKTLIQGSWPLSLGPGTEVPKCDDLIQLFIEAQTAPMPLALGAGGRENTMRQGATDSDGESAGGQLEYDNPFMRDFMALRSKPCIKAMLETEYPSGERHHAFMVIVSDLFHSGLSEQEIRSTVEPFILANNEDERRLELENHLRDLSSGTKLIWSCKDPARAKVCAAKCSMFSRLAPETQASRPLAQDQKTAEKQVKAAIPVMLSQYSDSLIERYSLIYVEEINQFYSFDSLKYVPMSDLEFGAMFEKRAPAISTNKNNSELIGKLKRKCAVSHDSVTQSTKDHINFLNGHFNKRTMVLEERSKDRYFTYCLPFDYDPNAIAPRWEQFMVECFRSKDSGTVDLESIQCLHEFIGYTISGDENWADKMMLAVGPSGANGKGTIWNTIRKLLGEGAYSALPVSMLGRENGRLALANKLANLSAEEPADAFIKNEAIIKSLSSRDAVEVRALYANSFSIVNRAKLWMSCNESPGSHDMSGGWFRRLLVLEFNNKAVDADLLQEEQATYHKGFVYLKDIKLEEKLAAELPGIFNLAMSAYSKALERSALTIPRSSRAAVQEMADDDLVLDVVRSVFKQGGENDHLSHQEIMAAFNSNVNARGAGVKVPMRKIMNTIRLTFKTKPYKSDNNRGLRLLALAPDLSGFDGIIKVFEKRSV